MDALEGVLASTSGICFGDAATVLGDVTAISSGNLGHGGNESTLGQPSESP